MQAYLTNRLRDPDLAADLTQETFLRFLEKVPEERDDIQNKRAYLFRMARNLAIDHTRQLVRRKTDMPGPDVLNNFVDDVPGQEEVTISRQRLERLRNILEELPLRTQQIFTLNRIEGLSYREVAQQLHISESSVQKHLAKALLHVTQRLREENSIQ